MRWLDLPEADRGAVVSLLRGFAQTKADEIDRSKRHPRARELKEWTAQRVAMVRAIRVAASTLEKAKRRVGR